MEPLVTVGYALGLAGWLLGIGLWGTWAREWFGLAARPSAATGWQRYFSFSTDHKVIGLQYLVTFVVVMLLGGLMAVVFRLELMDPDPNFLSINGFNTIMSLHGIFMVAVAVATIIGGMGNFLVPLLIGAEDVAFPRVNALSYWIIPPVAVLLLATPLAGGFDSGWTAYPPLSVLNVPDSCSFCWPSSPSASPPSWAG